MEAAGGKHGGGTVLRGADGSLYFIRDEMLEALRVEGEGLERMGSLLGHASEHAEAGDADAPEVQPSKGVAHIRYVSGDLLKDQPADKSVPELGVVKSTIMCPWFC
jgi:hypothetical protein